MRIFFVALVVLGFSIAVHSAENIWTPTEITRKKDSIIEEVSNFALSRFIAQPSDLLCLLNHQKNELETALKLFEPTPYQFHENKDVIPWSLGCLWLASGFCLTGMLTSTPICVHAGWLSTLISSLFDLKEYKKDCEKNHVKMEISTIKRLLKHELKLVNLEIDRLKSE